MITITVAKGEDEVLNFAIKDSSGNAVNITGGTAYFKVFSTPGGTAVLDITCVAIDASAGTCKATITDTQTGGLNAGIYYYELWLVDASSQKIQVLPTSPLVVLSGNAPS